MGISKTAKGTLVKRSIATETQSHIIQGGDKTI